MRRKELASYEKEAINSISMEFTFPCNNGANYCQWVVARKPHGYDGKEFYEVELDFTSLPNLQNQQILKVVEKIKSEGKLLKQSSSLSNPAGPGGLHWQSQLDTLSVYQIPTRVVKKVLIIMIEACKNPLEWNFNSYGYTRRWDEASHPYAKASTEARRNRLHQIANTIDSLNTLVGYYHEDVLEFLREEITSTEEMEGVDLDFT